LPKNPLPKNPLPKIRCFDREDVGHEVDVIEDSEDSAVIGLPHPTLGESVTAAVVVPPGAALCSRPTACKPPRRVILDRKLPRNMMGKARKALPRGRSAALDRREGG
jgi:malonyl-CoA/methylmalonyl-CoA synthetase